RIQDLIDSGQDFALGYLDLDNFKAFNDKYGFSRGDEVLMMTSRVIVNTVRRIAGQEGFVGHIGGDDFVFIVPIQVVEEVCIKIIQNFDSIVPNFYDPKDRNQGYISSVDRQGRQQEFLLMAVSIAVVFNLQGSLTHYAQASQIANSLKKKAKQDPASSYVLDRRRSP
ncbi:MAG: GGDEF domain-containing protein, partial [Desulfohalobiaceae bacterium]